MRHHPLCTSGSRAGHAYLARLQLLLFDDVGHFTDTVNAGLPVRHIEMTNMVVKGASGVNAGTSGMLCPHTSTFLV